MAEKFMSKSYMIQKSRFPDQAYCVTSLESRDPEIGRGLPNARAVVKNKQTNDVSIFYIPIVFCAKYIDRTTEKPIL